MSDCRNLIVVSDLHCGCRLGLCPPGGIELDDGGRYAPSAFQRKLWRLWLSFWDRWVPAATKGEPFDLVVNGDAIEGVHHNVTTTVSNSIEDQIAIARAVLQPVIERAERYYHIRGTEAHAGRSGVLEEQLAKSLGAVPNAERQYARYDLWKRVGRGLVSVLHHIGTTGSSAHEASAVNAELTAQFVESARWDQLPADVTVRSHRHRYLKVEFATARGLGISVVTPGWQGKTPFAWRVAGSRQAPPQFGGIVVRQGDRRLYVEAQVWTVDRSPEE